MTLLTRAANWNRRGRPQAAVEAIAGGAHGFCVVLSLSFFILVGLTSGSHDMFFAQTRDDVDT